MKGTVNWYTDKNKQGSIEEKDCKNVMIYEKDIPYFTLLHAGDHTEYLMEKTKDGIKAIRIKEITN